MAEPIKSPCIGVCSTTLGDLVCRGCGRTVDEIRDWGSMSPEARADIQRMLSAGPVFTHRTKGGRYRVRASGVKPAGQLKQAAGLMVAYQCLATGQTYVRATTEWNEAMVRIEGGSL